MQHERKYWFSAKRYGWGWGIPSFWQGWLVLAAFVALLVVGSFLFPPNAKLGAYLAYVAVLCVLPCRNVLAKRRTDALPRRRPSCGRACARGQPSGAFSPSSRSGSQRAAERQRPLSSRDRPSFAAVATAGMCHERPNALRQTTVGLAQ
jgi:hypothetical protein